MLVVEDSFSPVSIHNLHWAELGLSLSHPQFCLEFCFHFSYFIGMKERYYTYFRQWMHLLQSWNKTIFDGYSRLFEHFLISMEVLRQKILTLLFTLLNLTYQITLEKVLKIHAYRLKIVVQWGGDLNCKASRLSHSLYKLF